MMADNQGLRMPLGVVLMAPMTKDIIRSEKGHLATQKKVPLQPIWMRLAQIIPKPFAAN